jgi:hypothetical protein
MIGLSKTDRRELFRREFFVTTNTRQINSRALAMSQAFSSVAVPMRVSPFALTNEYSYD